jgi:hypothetical protein
VRSAMSTNRIWKRRFRWNERIEQFYLDDLQFGQRFVRQ